MHFGHDMWGAALLGRQEGQQIEKRVRRTNTGCRSLVEQQLEISPACRQALLFLQQATESKALLNAQQS
jgi:hypothetical protein